MRLSASPRKAAMLRTVQQIASGLLRISELCSECIRQVGYLDDPKRLCGDDFADDLQQVIDAIGSIEGALQQGDTQQALTKAVAIIKKRTRHIRGMNIISFAWVGSPGGGDIFCCRNMVAPMTSVRTGIP